MAHIVLTHQPGRMFFYLALSLFARVLEHATTYSKLIKVTTFTPTQGQLKSNVMTALNCATPQRFVPFYSRQGVPLHMRRFAERYLPLCCLCSVPEDGRLMFNYEADVPFVLSGDSNI